MKVVILAGGVGNRLGGDTEEGPKPMLDIGGRPILWHIMSHYAAYGHRDFVVAAGYRGEQIKRYFADFKLTSHDVKFDLSTGHMGIEGDETSPDWTVEVVDTGRRTESAGRVKRLAEHVGGSTFMVTFGDAVANIDLDALLDVHHSQGKLATISAVHPPPRFGELVLDDDQVKEFSEKPMDAGWINGGFMVFETGVLDYIEGDHVPFAPEPMQRLADDEELIAYRHDGFWQSVDSLRDKVLLDRLWEHPSPPWKVWR